MDIAKSIKTIEKSVGHLSPVQKILLGTDGSVTQLLEAVTGHAVTIRTIEQAVVPADAVVAGNLGVPEGEPVNHRVVELKDATNGQVLIYAVSKTPLSRLNPCIREDLMKADIPIGKIIRQHRIEARREIVCARAAPASSETAKIFHILRNEPHLTRQYRIIHRGEPLIHITEQFPYNRFLDERRVIVETGSRIHLGLIEMHGGSGRVDGGIGIALSDPGILLEARLADGTTVTGCDEPTRQVVRSAAEQALAGIHAGAGVSVTVRSSYPAHTGLGSGSQTALATAQAVAMLYDRQVSVQDLARMTGAGRDIRHRNRRVRARGVHHRRRAPVRAGGREGRLCPVLRLKGPSPGAGHGPARLPGGLEDPACDPRCRQGSERRAGARHLPQALSCPAGRGGGPLPRGAGPDACGDRGA